MENVDREVFCSKRKNYSGQKVIKTNRCELVDLIGEAMANIEPQLRVANHFYTWMDFEVVNVAISWILYHSN